MRARFVFAAAGEVSTRPGETGPIHVDGSLPASEQKAKSKKKAAPVGGCKSDPRYSHASHAGESRTR